MLYYLLDTHWMFDPQNCEHLSCILPLLVVFFIPIAIWSSAEFVTFPMGRQRTEKSRLKAESRRKGSQANGEKVEAEAEGHGDKGGKRVLFMDAVGQEYNETHETHDHAWYAKKGYLNSGFWHLRWVACFVLGCVHMVDPQTIPLHDADGASVDRLQPEARGGWHLCVRPTLTIGAWTG